MFTFTDMNNKIQEEKMVFLYSPSFDPLDCWVFYTIF